MINNFAILIGAMKCGTTSLFAHLSHHPQIAPAKNKEPHFFSKDRNLAKGIHWYHRRWSWNPCVHRIAMEASTSYTKMPRFPNAAERIATVKANFRFIYILRNPIDRIESHYAHQVLAGRVPPPKSTQATIDPNWIAISKYAMQIAEYYERFDANRILLLDFEELKTDPVALVGRVCRFLEVDLAFDPAHLETIHNPARQFHPFYHALMRAPFVEAVVEQIPLGLKNSLRNILGRKPGFNIKLTQDQRETLWQELEEDMKRLNEEYGFDTSRWNKQSESAEEVP